MDFIRVPFGYVLEFFYGFLNNYGLALILFSFVVKLILLPFSAKSKKSMMKMSRLQPQLKQLELACGDDKQKYQQEVMALYKSEGVSMYGGCLWSFLPLLFLLPLYTVIREPLHYLMHLNTETVDALKAIVATEQGVEVSKLGYYWQYGPAADLQKYALQLTDASMREAVMGVSSINFSFLGINLGQIPSWKVWQAKGWSDIGGFIVPLLSGGLNYLSMFISQKMNGSVISNANGGKDEAAAKSAQTNKMMNLLMPLMSIWFGFIVPLGLSIYWLTQSLFGIVQDMFLTKHYRKIYDAEDVVRREKAAQRAAEEAEKERIRAARRAANPEASQRTPARRSSSSGSARGARPLPRILKPKSALPPGLRPRKLPKCSAAIPSVPSAAAAPIPPSITRNMRRTNNHGKVYRHDRQDH